MLLHSRTGPSEHRAIDLNTTVEEALNLAYHGARAETPGFNITLEKDLDPAAGTVDAVSAGVHPRDAEPDQQRLLRRAQARQARPRTRTSSRRCGSPRAIWASRWKSACATTAPASARRCGTRSSNRSSPPSRPAKAPGSACRSATTSSSSSTAGQLTVDSQTDDIHRIHHHPAAQDGGERGRPA